MKVAVCTPWVDMGCPWRALAKEWTQRHWDSVGVEVVYGTSEGEPVNRAAARNDAARKTDADVIVFADADTWIEADAFTLMVLCAADTNRLVHGYTRHVKLEKRTTLRLYNGEHVRAGTFVANQPSGVIAVSRELLELIGGHDERFVGWGGEDRAFQLACNAIAGMGSRISGDSYHCWHPNDPARGRATQQKRRNIALAMRYKQAAGNAARLGPLLPRTKEMIADPARMLELLREPGAPLAVGISE